MNGLSDLASSALITHVAISKKSFELFLNPLCRIFSYQFSGNHWETYSLNFFTGYIMSFNGLKKLQEFHKLPMSLLKRRKKKIRKKIHYRKCSSKLISKPACLETFLQQELLVSYQLVFIVETSSSLTIDI